MKRLRLFVMLAVVASLFSCHNKQEEIQNHMTYRDLGATGLKVSEVSIGCGAFGKMDTAQARAFMDVAIDSGVNYIDIYDANPTVRGNIGYALEGRRDKMIVQGHIGSYWNAETEQYERTRDVEKAKKGFADMLSLLHTDYIEVGMVHIIDDLADWDTIQNSPFMEYVKQLKAEGKIQHIGVSSHNAAVALAAAKSGIFEVIMFSLNPAFDRIASDANAWDPESYKNMLPGIDPVRVELYDYCAQHNIAITAMKVFASGGGRLLSAEKSPMGKVFTPSQCIAYALAKPCVATAVCGASNIEELLSDLAYLSATEEEKDFSAVLNESTVSGDGECTYCNHCSPCPKEIDIAKVNELLDHANQAGMVTPELQKQYDALPHHASECVQCGACETRCPFEVPIRERMLEAAKIFGK